MSLSPFIGAGGEWHNLANVSSTGSAITIAIDTEDESSGGVIAADLGNFDFEFLVSGCYSITATYGFDVTFGTSRSIGRGFLEIDTGSGFAAMLATLTNQYNRTLAAGEGSGSRTTRRYFNKGDKIRMRLQRIAGSSTVSTNATANGLTITFLSDR